MGWIDEAPAPQPILPTGTTAPNPIRPGALDVVGAAFRQENPMVSVARRLWDGFYAPEPGHNPLNHIAGTMFEERFSDRFVGSQSGAETFAIMQRIQEEERDRETLDAAGFGGTVAQIGAGILDPTLALPGGVLVRGVRGGYAVMKSAASVGAAAALSTSVSETALQLTHETRTLGESMAAVSSAAILGGLIGGGAAAFLSKAERQVFEQIIDRERVAIDAHANGLPAPPPVAERLVKNPEYELWDLQKQIRIQEALRENPYRADTQDVVYRILDEIGPPPPEMIRGTPEAAGGAPSSAGAATRDARALELESSGLGFTAGISPTRRVLSADSTEARRAMADLAEQPYRFKENEQGIATTEGPALDRIARNQINGTRVEVSDGLDRLFSEYRFGSPETTVPRLKARFEDFMGQAPDRLSFDDFKKEVSKALQEGDTHTVPQVQQAAQLIRQRVFEPWKERAIAAGLLPEGIETKTAASYFQRVYNKERIRAERPFFVNKVTDWLKSDQMTKAAQKDRISAYNNSLTVANETIEKLTAELATARAGLERVEIRADEAGAGTRAVLEPSVRARTNTLANQASGREAKIAALESRLATEIDNAAEMRTKIEEEIAAWQGKSVSEAKSAMKARQAAEDERIAAATAKGEPAPTKRLSAADSAIDRAVKRILESDRDLSDAELRARGHEITERILGSPDGRLPYDLPSGGPEIGWKGGGEPPRGPLAARQFNIPDAVIRDFLEDDVETVVAMHLRTIVPDVLLTERFGDARMTEAFKKVEEDYARLTDAATSNKERARLGKEREAVIRDIAAVRDRVRGVYGWSPELRNMARIAAGAKAVNNLTSMGMSAVSSLSDFAGSILRFGLTNTFNDGWRPFVGGMIGQNEGWAQFKTQIRAIGIGVDVATNARQNALDDITDVYRPGSRFERGLQAVNDKFFIANLLSPLTDMQKTIAAHVAVSEILRATKAAAEGKATKRQIGNLAESGIDQNMAGRIWANFQTGGEVVDGVHLPNTKDWTDQAAADALNGAMSREVDIAVVTPGQEKPLWMSHPVLSLLGQFKSFTAAATERILVANLMRRDAHALTGVLASMALGMISYKVNSFLGGQDTSKRPQDWVKEGVSRGGLLGWFEEGNAMASKMTRGGVDVYRMIGADKPLSRFASRSTLDMLLGPTASKIEGLAKVTGAAAARDWSAADTTAMRRLMAFQNLIWLRGAINQAEGGFNRTLGVPPRAEPEQRR